MNGSQPFSPMFQPKSGLQPILLAGPVLALTVLLPWQGMWICALGAIIVLGVPHGALDGEIARSLLRPRFSWLWFPIFSVPYLLLAAFVLFAWHVAPLWTLAAFLAASTWHFGSEDVPSGRILTLLVRGGLPIALPVLVHPTATAFVFATIAQTSFAQPPGWLWQASLCWLVLAIVWIVLEVSRRGVGSLAQTLVLGCLFIALPPLLAFAIYFVCVHAPAHTAALIANPARAPRVHDLTSAVVLSLPVTILTIIIGAALWPIYTGPVAVRLLSLTIQILSALTLPHMLFEIWLTKRERAGNGPDLAARSGKAEPLPG